MPKISVIIPVYNTESLLSTCLDSVCAQTLKDLEIICINDCSTDNSPEILRDYADRDDRIRIIDFDRNQGVSVARNTGIMAACGEYTGFVDSDDTIDSDFYEKLYSGIRDSAHIVKGGIRRITGDNSPLMAETDYLNHEVECQDEKFYYFCSAIYQTSFLVENKIFFPEKIKYGEDLCFGFQAALLANQIEFVPDVYYCYYYNPDSVVNNISKNTFLYIHSKMLMTDQILEYMNTGKVDKAMYIKAASWLLIDIHFAAGYLYSLCKGLKIEDQWIEYVLKKCDFPKEVSEQYHRDISEMQEKLKKYKLELVRKKMLARR